MSALVWTDMAAPRQPKKKMTAAEHKRRNMVYQAQWRARQRPTIECAPTQQAQLGGPDSHSLEQVGSPPPTVQPPALQPGSGTSTPLVHILATTHTIQALASPSTSGAELVPSLQTLTATVDGGSKESA